MSFALKALSLVCAAFSALHGFLFYTLYWKWRLWFHNGRYFDERESVVYTDDAVFYSAPTVCMAVLAWWLWRRATNKQKNAYEPAIYTRPLWIGVLLAPCITPFGFYAMSALKDFFTATHVRQGSQTWQDISIALLIIYAMSAPLFTVVGVPVMLWLKNRGSLSWTHVCISSTVLAMLGGFAIWHAFSSQSMTDAASGEYRKNVFLVCAACASIGLSIGVVFCLAIGLKRRQMKTVLSGITETGGFKSEVQHG